MYLSGEVGVEKVKEENSARLCGVIVPGSMPEGSVQDLCFACFPGSADAVNLRRSEDKIQA